MNNTTVTIAGLLLVGIPVFIVYFKIVFNRITQIYNYERKAIDIVYKQENWKELNLILKHGCELNNYEYKIWKKIDYYKDTKIGELMK
jgi:hypothetical protein